MPLAFVETTKAHGTSSAAPVPIPELSLALPEGAGEQALVILNLPNVYVMKATGGDPGGAMFHILVNGTALRAYALINPTPTNATNKGQQTVTLVVAVPLKFEAQTITATWQTTNGFTVVAETASLSARS